MNIKFAVLCSEGNLVRCQNVNILKKTIPELSVIMANKNDVFFKHIGLFSLEYYYDGIVILEDDVKLCRNFKERLYNILDNHKNEVVSMFESAVSKKELQSEYRPGARFAWNQCNYYPAEICKLLADEKMVGEFIQWFYAKKNEPWNYPIDTYIAYVLGRYKINYWMQVPFLVQHMAIPSNFKGRPLNRQSKYFIDDLEAQV